MWMDAVCEVLARWAGRQAGGVVNQLVRSEKRALSARSCQTHLVLSVSRVTLSAVVEVSR